MPFFKASFFYSQTYSRTAGWTENFWLEAADLASANTAGSKLRDKLVAIHGKQTTLQRTRVSEANNTRLFIITNYAPVAQGGDKPIVEAEQSDYPETAFLLEASGINGRLTRQWIKGIPDPSVEQGGLWQQNVITRQYEAFTKFLSDQNNGVRIRCVAADNAPKPITAIAEATGIVSCVAHGYATNSLVRIRNVQFWPYPLGVWRIGKVTADTFQLKGWNPRINHAPPDYTAAQALTNVFSYSAAKWEIARISNRKVGRPFGSPVGSQKRQR